MADMNELPERLTIKDTAKLLGVARMTVYRLIRQGDIKVHRNPLLKRGPAMLDRDDVQRLLDKLSSPPA